MRRHILNADLFVPTSDYRDFGKFISEKPMAVMIGH
jgi:hypothetical protein